MNQDTSLEKRIEERKNATADILYLLHVTALYIFSLLLFPVGIVFGIILKLGSYTDHAKKIGTVALILGLIGLGLSVLVFLVLIITGLAFFGWYV